MENILVQLKKTFRKWWSDYDYKTFINSALSRFMTAAFALYNGFLGLLHASPWHLSICVYYLLLALLRTVIINSERKAVLMDRLELRKKTHLFAALNLFLLNLCLTGPIYLMIRQEKPVTLTLIPAIAMAAYTTFKVTMAAVNLRKKNNSENRLVRLLRTINFMDALQSIVVLQNTLIMVSDKGDRSSMIPFTAATSILIWAVIVAMSVLVLVESRKTEESE